MKIRMLRVDNLKGVKHVEIKPGENVIVIAGNNGAGKTSVLDAVAWGLLGGREMEKTPKPIREGEEEAKVVIELDDFIVQKKWTDKTKTGYLQVVGKDNTKYSRPQELLSGFIGKLTFDPGEFSELRAKEQRFMLVDLVGIKDKLAVLDEKRGKLFDERTLVSRDVRKTEAIFEALPIPDKDLPENPVSVMEISGKLRRAIEANNDIDMVKNAVGRNKENLENYNEEIDMLMQKIDSLKVNIETENKSLENNLKFIKGSQTIDIKPIEEEIQKAEMVNSRISEAREFRELDKKLQGITGEVKTLSGAIGKLDNEKEATIKDAPMPIEGLGIEDDFVSFRGIPYNQLSKSEQIKVSVKIAMAMNPDLRVILMTYGSLLDDDAMDYMEKVSKEEDYQIWVERISIDKYSDVILVDGEVKEA